MIAGLLTTKRLVLAGLCGVAVAAGACSDASGTLARPSATTEGSSRVLVAPVVPADAIAAKKREQVPFHGSLEGNDTDSVSFPFLSVHATGSGNATHLGNYMAVIDFRVDLRTPGSPAVGSFTLTAANGDCIFGNLLGRASIANGIATVVETASITGGTGRFVDATGNFTTARTVVQATGIFSGSFDGMIDLHE
jgi:hypothetical protein